jgi:phosphatidate phosphatase APP1
VPALISRVRRAWSHRHDPVIRPYIGQVIDRKLLLGGRVLRQGAMLAVDDASSRRRNLFNMYRSFATTKVSAARLEARFGGASTTVSTDSGGYFSVEMALVAPVHGPLWQHVEFELIEAPHYDGPPVRAVGQVLVHPSTSRFAVISDVDDTVLASAVTSRIRMLLTVLMSNAHTRKPFAGVGAFYRALEKGHGAEHNPIFYVSNGPWNLHDLLVDFFRLNDIPLGPIYLRDWGAHLILSPQPAGTHKRKQIERIMAFFPRVPVVMIGDSGEHDPEIFAQVARDFPGRVHTIYIRCVDDSTHRRQSMEKLADELRSAGVDFLMVSDSEEAAVHACEKGLIRDDALASVRRDRQQDES